VGATCAVSTGLWITACEIPDGTPHDDGCVVMCEAAMLRHLLLASGINDANIGRHDDVGRARTFWRPRSLNIRSNCGRRRNSPRRRRSWRHWPEAAPPRSAWRLRCVCQPEQRDIVLERLQHRISVPTLPVGLRTIDGGSSLALSAGMRKTRFGSIGDWPCLAVMMIAVCLVSPRCFSSDTILPIAASTNWISPTSALMACRRHRIASGHIDALLDKLLTDAHRLEIHAEDVRHPPGCRAVMA